MKNFENFRLTNNGSFVLHVFFKKLSTIKLFANKY